MTFYRVDYFLSAEAEIFRGSIEDLQNYISKTGKRARKRRDGSWTVYTPVEGNILEIVDGHINRTIMPKEFMKSRYNKKILTEKDYKLLVEELADGIISFDELY